MVLHGTLHDKARTLSNDGSLAGAWLHNVPKKDELHMNNDDFPVAVQLRLGKPFRDRPTRCKCTKKTPIDALHRAASLNNIPYSVLLSYWRRRIATTLQVYNARIINQAYVTLNDYGGGN